MDKEFLMRLECSKLSRLIWIFIVPLILLNIPSTVLAQQNQELLINWLELCENPLVDALISEPCHTLTTPDGFTLTKEGEKVLGCLGGGTLAILAGIPELATMGELVGCGDYHDSGVTFNSSNLINDSHKNNELISEVSAGWKKFDQGDGLFSLEIPSNWYPERTIDFTNSSFDYRFYPDSDNMTTEVTLFITKSNYSNSREVAESTISEAQLYDANVSVLEPVNCNSNLNNIPACSFSLTYKMEDGIQVNIITVLSVDSDGIYVEATYAAISNIYDISLPIGMYIINSISFDSDRIKEVFGLRQSPDLQTELSSLSQNQTHGTESLIPENQTNTNKQPPGFEISEF